MDRVLLNDSSPTPHIPLHDMPQCEGDSSSSGDSDAPINTAVPDPVSAQLINNITMLDYRSLGNTSPLILNEEELSKSEGIISGISAKPLPHFVTWNWPLIRNILFWGVLSALLACLAVVISFVATLPKKCDPESLWYQGNLFYEIFPASFQDSNSDGIGDIRGLISRIQYIEGLGVKTVRLNSIFKAKHYPERYREAESLIDVDEHIGSVVDVLNLLKELHLRNMMLVLDLPIHPFVTSLVLQENYPASQSMDANETNNTNATKSNNKRKMNATFDNIVVEDKVATALKYWVSNGIDGFYLKGAESLVEDPLFSDCLSYWKSIIGPEKIFLVSYETVAKAKYPVLQMILFKVSLVDVYLELANGTEHIMEQVDRVTGGLLWEKPTSPWVHWTVGSAETRRLSSLLSPNHTLAAILFNIMLPGTPSIFYGDEIGLKAIADPEEDFHESQQIHNLISMEWSTSKKTFTSKSALPWAQGEGRSTKEGQENPIAELSLLRRSVATIYMNSIWTEGIGSVNMELRQIEGVLILERWLPRRNTYVTIVNLSNANRTVDLSHWFYKGVGIISTTQQYQGEEFLFGKMDIQPAEVIIIKLYK